MDAKIETLTPAAELARDNPVRFPNESAAYRAARRALLAEEMELRRHLERVAAQCSIPRSSGADRAGSGLAHWPMPYRSLRRV